MTEGDAGQLDKQAQGYCIECGKRKEQRKAECAQSAQTPQRIEKGSMKERQARERR